MNDLDFNDDDSYGDSSNKKDYISGDGWEPIEDDITPFTGTFDGAGHTISGLFIHRPMENFVGLFGYVASTDGAPATITDLGLNGMNVTGNDSTGGITGHLVGVSNADGEIQRVFGTGDITGKTKVGGIIGYLDDKVLLRMRTRSAL